jgi:hypothetical protein
LHIGRKAAHRIFKRYFEIVANVFAAVHARAATAPALSEDIAETEEVAEDIAEVRENGFVEARSAGPVHALMTEPVVSGALLRIAQNGVRFGRLFEPLLRLAIVRIAVRMVLQR